MKKGDWVFWKYNGKIYSGLLEYKELVVAHIPMDEDGYLGNIKKDNRYSWNIKGDDGHEYALFEDELTTDIKSLGN